MSSKHSEECSDEEALLDIDIKKRQLRRIKGHSALYNGSYYCAPEPQHNRASAMTMIRRATADDAEFLAWVLLYASRAQVERGIWDLIIGADEQGCLEYLRRLAMAEPRSLCHYSNFLVAQVNGSSAAALAAFDVHPDAWAIVYQAMSTVQKELGWSEADVMNSRRRMAPLWPCFLAEIGADYCIESVATRPEYRRKGLVAALVEHALGEAMQRGRKLVQITTFLGNAAAISAYEKCGFRVTEEKRCEPMQSALGVAGFVRLLRDL